MKPVNITNNRFAFKMLFVSFTKHDLGVATSADCNLSHNDLCLLGDHLT
jgi:hypothetical protein